MGYARLIKLALSSWDDQYYSENRLYRKADPTCSFWNDLKDRKRRCSNDRRENILHIKSGCLKSLYLRCRKNIVSDMNSMLYFLHSFNT